jgi:hypothetical protein
MQSKKKSKKLSPFKVVVLIGMGLSKFLKACGKLTV